MLARLGVRRMLCCSAFSSAPALRSTGSTDDCSSVFAGFSATMARSVFCCPFIIGYGLAAFPMRTVGLADGQAADIPVPAQGVSTRWGLRPRRAGPALALSRLPSCLPLASRRRHPGRHAFRGSMTQPMRSPVNASPRTSRCVAHDSRPVRLASPSLQGTFTINSLPVSRRTTHASNIACAPVRSRAWWLQRRASTLAGRAVDPGACQCAPYMRRIVKRDARGVLAVVREAWPSFLCSTAISFVPTGGD